jgi:hypothetical protein
MSIKSRLNMAMAKANSLSMEKGPRKKGKEEKLVLKTKKAEVISTTPQKVGLAKDSCVNNRKKVCTGGTAGRNENYDLKMARQEMGAKKSYNIFKQNNKS